MAFRAQLKVCFGDIDNAGIVYYPRFLHYFHVALEEFFSTELRIDYAKMYQKHGIAFPTVRLETDFKRPLKYGDRIDVEVMVLHIGNTSIKWGYTVYKSGEFDTVVVMGSNVTVCMNMEAYEKVEIPDWLRQALEAYQRRCKEGVDV